MPKVEITRLGAKRDLKPLGAVGEVVDVDEELAKALCAFAMAKPVVETATAAPAETADADAPETATAPPAETPEDKPATAKVIRQWANDNGVDVPARGAIPADVVEKFDAAMRAAKSDD